MAGDAGGWYAPPQPLSLGNHLPADTVPAAIPYPCTRDVRHHTVGAHKHPCAPTVTDAGEHATGSTEQPVGTPPDDRPPAARAHADPADDAADTACRPDTSEHTPDTALATQDVHRSKPFVPCAVSRPPCTVSHRSSAVSRPSCAVSHRSSAFSHPHPDGHHQDRPDDDMDHLTHRGGGRAADGRGRGCR
ncbi:hypothetical protein ACWD5V_15460 [Streptomyces sp. NPDC002523]